MSHFQVTWRHFRRSFQWKILVACICFGSTMSAWAVCETACKDAQWWGDVGFTPCRQFFKTVLGEEVVVLNCQDGGLVPALTGDVTKECIYDADYFCKSMDDCTNACTPGMGQTGKIERTPGGKLTYPEFAKPRNICKTKLPPSDTPPGGP